MSRIRWEHIGADDVESDAVDGDSGTGTGIAPNIDGKPDILLSDIGHLPKLTVEVEHAAALRDNPGEFLDQFERYRAVGRKRILAVPEGDEDAMREFLDERGDEISGEYYTATVTQLDQFL